VVERDIPEPRSGHVRVQVEACGICHSDVFVEAIEPIESEDLSSIAPVKEHRDAH
jgi:NADPH2:quinone reductase